VQTQYTREEGGDDRWYSGTITKVFANGHASIKYDDGDKWTGHASDIHLLNPSPARPSQPLVQSADGCHICTAVVPPGGMPGMPIEVAGPGGQPMQVACPPGVLPGQSFQFKVPIAAQTVVQAVPVVAPQVVMGQPVMGQPYH